jgi:hypothetical protein
MGLGKPVAAFAVKFLVLYGLLAASWPLVGGVYAYFFRQSGETFLEVVGIGKDVRIRPAAEPKGLNDVVFFTRGTTGEQRQRALSSWLMGFHPTAMVVALVLATPVSAQRRFRALCAGFIIIHSFVLLRIAVFAMLSGVTAANTTFMETAMWIAFMFVHGHGVSLIVPVLVWLAVTIRREDVRCFVTVHQ